MTCRTQTKITSFFEWGDGRKWFFLAIFIVVSSFGVLFAVGYESFGRSIVVESKSVSSIPPLEKAVSPPTTPNIRRPVKVHGIYMSSWVAGNKKFRGKLVKLIQDTELNAVVIDVKDFSGKVAFPTGNQLIKDIGSVEVRIPDLQDFLNELHQDGIYAIARMEVFQDPMFAKARPQFAVQHKNGTVWKDKKGLAWIDPASIEAWKYNVEVAKEAEKQGFDEIQVDYARFPSDGNLSDMKFPVYTGTYPKREVIRGFLAYFSKELKKTGVFVSGDFFGLTMWNKDDLGVGQVLEDAVTYLDYVSPMVYPSHYPKNFNGYKNPAAYPYEIVEGNMEKGKKRLGADFKKIRPWLQDFNLGAVYDAAMVRKQIKAVYDSGLEEWLLWNAGNIYTRDALR